LHFKNLAHEFKHTMTSRTLLCSNVVLLKRFLQEFLDALPVSSVQQKNGASSPIIDHTESLYYQHN